MFRLQRIALVIGLAAGAGLASAQAPATRRPTPPTRDPHTPGYVTAKELPDGSNPPANADGNFIIGPTHNPAPEMSVHEGVPQGTVYEFTMRLGGQQDLSRHRAGAAYLWHAGSRRPRQTGGDHQPSRSLHSPRGGLCPQTICPGQQSRPSSSARTGPTRCLFTALDNLIAEHRVPVMIAISIGNGGGDAQGSERGLEYDTMSGRYAEFVEKEVLPLVEAKYHVKLTKDPDGRATMGGSSGGSCALIMAWYHPELYHRVLTYSGTLRQSAVAVQSRRLRTAHGNFTNT